MDTAIVEFLRLANSLRQTVTKVKPDAPTFDLATWTRDFKSLADRLACPDEHDNSHKRRDVIDACLKVCRDVVVRLDRCSHAAGENQANNVESRASAVQIQANFNERDMDALAVRLFDLTTDYKSLWPSNTVPEANHVSKEYRSEDNNQQPGPQQTNGTKGVPSRPAPAGVLQDFILEALSFKSMRDREEEVAEAHAKTFDWIFDEDRQPEDPSSKTSNQAFVRWLGSRDLGSIYWVTGKPGSGKSTLVRYVSDHKKTAKLLKSWAGDAPLAKASFYFWTSGSEEQRSQSGLLRSLLHQLLSYSPESIPEAFPQLWQKLKVMTTKERINFPMDWTVPDLMSGFQRFLKHALPQLKICLLVDGLDEFNGDHESIIHFFRDLTTSYSASDLKMCLSSRQWDVFEKAFQFSVPNLRLQDLTFHDMRQYVSDNLQKSSHIHDMLQQSPGLKEDLVTEISNRADGVFLWVRLVVSKILDKFHGKTSKMADIQAFLHTLPTELDDLFELFLFRSQSETQLMDAAQIFQLIRAREIVSDFIKDDSANSLTIWEIAFASTAEDDSRSLTDPVEEATDDFIMTRCMKTRDHILVRSTGLLAVYPERSRGSAFSFSRNDHSRGALARKLAAHRVTYVHRTIRDYIMLSNGVWDRLVSHSGNTFDPHLRLLRSYILRLKNPLEEIEHHRRLDEWYPDIALSLTHARHVSRDKANLETRLVTELDKTISWFWLARSSDPHDHWARSCFGTYEERKGNKLIVPHPYLALCTRFGLERYVLSTLDAMASGALDTNDDNDSEEDENERQPAQPVEETPLLARALEFLTSRQKTKFPLSNPRFVRALLERSRKHGTHEVLGPLIGGLNTTFSSPLAGRVDVTPWIMVLRHLRDAKRRGWIEPFDVDAEGTKRWTGIVEMLLKEGGADRDAVVKKDGWDPETDVQGVIGPKGILNGIGDYWVERLSRVVAG